MKPFILTFIFSLSLFVGCGRAASTSAQKISNAKSDQVAEKKNDLETSSVDVRQAIIQVWALATNDLNMSIVDLNDVTLLKAIDEKIKNANFRKVGLEDDKSRLLKIGNSVFGFDHQRGGVDRFSPHYDLVQSKLLISEFEGCGESTLDNMASVDDFRVGSQICFSVVELAKVPHERLVPKIVSLLVHEMVHLGGYGEKDATNIQKLIEADSEEMQKLTAAVFAKQASDALVLLEKDLLNSVQNESQKTAIDLKSVMDRIVVIQKLVLVSEREPIAVAVLNRRYSASPLGMINKVELLKKSFEKLVLNSSSDRSSSDVKTDQEAVHQNLEELRNALEVYVGMGFGRDQHELDENKKVRDRLTEIIGQLNSLQEFPF